MSFFQEVRERRLVPWMGAYIVTGFVALEGADQIVGRGLIPDFVYEIVLFLYLFGIPFTAVLAWFHGAKGAQKPTPLELWLLSSIAIVAGWVTYNRTEQSLMAERAAELLATEGLEPTSIAVLYLEDLSPGAELQHVADGLTESLIDRLSQVRSLDVVSRNGVGRFRGADTSRDSIARALEVGTVVDGSVEQAGGDIRVTLRLVDGASGADFQRTSLELPAEELIALQDSVALEVSRSLREWLGEEVAIRSRMAGTDSREAWSLVQRAEGARKSGAEAAGAGEGEAAWNDYRRADSILAIAEAEDPDWAEPVALRADGAYRQARLVSDSAEEAIPLIERGVALAGRALEKEGNHAGALETRGTILYFRYLMQYDVDEDEREALLDRARDDLLGAIDQQPTRASAHSTLSHLYFNVGDVPSAVLSARRAYEEDAYLSVADVVLSRLFWGSYDLGMFAQAKRWCDEGSRRFPEAVSITECDLWMMVTDSEQPDVDRAWRIRQELLDSTSEDQQAVRGSLFQVLVGAVIARAGLPDSANATWQAARVGTDIDPPQDNLGLEAAMRSVTGQADEAIEILRRYVAGSPGHSFDVGGDIHWWWRPLTSHPEFRSVTGSQ